MNYNVIIKDMNPNIEEEITILINDIEITCFIGYCPNKIVIGEKYSAEIGLFVIDALELKEQDSASKSVSIFKTEEGTYILNGFLNDIGQLDIGFFIEDEILTDYKYLYGNFITLMVDRLTIDFE